MSRFFSDKFSDLEAYIPGEQPQNRQYIKLNTNESPFGPVRKAVDGAAREARRMQPARGSPAMRPLIK